MDSTNCLKQHYNKKGIKIFYESQKEGYWLNLNDSRKSFFIDKTAFEEIAKKKGEDLRKILETYDNLILPSLMDKGIFLSNLEKAFERTISKEKEELFNFRKANNL